MSEEQGQQGSEVGTGTAPPMTDEHRWGEPISYVRKAELQAILDAWNASGTRYDNRKGPFDTGREVLRGPGGQIGSADLRGLGYLPEGGVHLTGADVFWLANQVPNLDMETLYVNTPLCQYPVNGVAE